MLYVNPTRPMKLADLYRDWRIMGGIALATLGAGNWFVGLSRTQQYSQIIANAPDRRAIDEVYGNFDELDVQTDAAVLEPFVAEQRKVSYATARMDFYHTAFLTGRILVVGGLTIMFLGFLGVIRADGARAAGRNRFPDGGS
jgi:hypothetical protein